MTPSPLLDPSLILGLGLLLLPCLALSSSGQTFILDTQAMTDQPECSKTCSKNSLCDRYVFLKNTCFLLSCFNVSNCKDVPVDLLTEEEFNRGLHGNNGPAAAALGSPDPGTDPVPGPPTELQSNSSSSGITLNSDGSSLDNATGAPSPSSSSLNQTISTSPESGVSGGPSSSAGGALPHLNSSSDSSVSQPVAPIQQQNPVNNASAADWTLDPSHQPATQSPVMTPPAGPQPVTGAGPVGTTRTAPAGPAMTSASTSSPIAAARTTTTTTATTTTTSTMSVKTIAPMTTAPPATTATSTTSTTPKAKAPIITTPIPTITTTTATTTVAIPTTSTSTTATTTTSTATEAPPDTEQKPSAQALPEPLSPTANPKVPPARTSGAGTKMEDAAGPRGSVIEVAGAPLAKQLVDTAALWAVMVFGLLFFLITVALFMTQAYESYRRKDYTQVDYLINGMYTDSGV